MKKKYFIFPGAIFVILMGIAMLNLTGDKKYERILSEYKSQLLPDMDIAKVKEILANINIQFSVEKKESFTELNRKYTDKKYASVLIFNAYSNRDDWVSILGQTDLLIEVGFDEQGKVVEVSSERVNTFL